MNIGLIIEHIKNHIHYPASVTEIEEECSKLSEFTDEEKKWFQEHMPDGIYESPEEVLRSLGLRGKQSRFRTLS